jgi:hypothetical protein
MAFAQGQHPAGGLGPGSEHEPLGVGIRLQASQRDFDHFYACAGQDRVERHAELPGPVTDQEPVIGRTLTEIHQQIADLLRSAQLAHTKSKNRGLIAEHTGAWLRRFLAVRPRASCLRGLLLMPALTARRSCG